VCGRLQHAFGSLSPDHDCRSHGVDNRSDHHDIAADCARRARPPPPTTTTTTLADPHAAPSWLGSRPLPLRADGFGEVQPTPPELVDRSISTVDLLPAPPGTVFESTVGPIPADVLERSTWSPDCPVSLEQLSYVTVAHWGFDGAVHTGELIVHADHARAIVDVFARLHDARFPIEQMRVIRSDELDLPPTGDGNITTSFVCRPAVGSTRGRCMPRGWPSTSTRSTTRT
jgi:hypothetical protein